MALHRLGNKSEIARGSVKRIDDLAIAVYNLDGTFFRHQRCLYPRPGYVV